jgi:hypothetical protein
MKKTLFLLLLITVIPMLSSAQIQIDNEVRKSLKVYFRQGSADLDDDYMGNRVVLSDFARDVKQYYQDSTAKFRRLRVVASASPEGSRDANNRVAKARAAAIANWVGKEIAVDLDYAVEFTGINWRELERLIKNNENVPHRDEVLNLLRGVDATNEAESNLCFERLKNLRNEVPYKWIYSNLFPKMRYAAVRAEFWWEKEPTLLISTKSPIEFSADGGSGEVKFEKTIADNVYPKVTCSADWVKNIEVQDGGIKYTVMPSLVSQERATSLVIECYNVKHEVRVNQQAAPEVAPAPVTEPKVEPKPEPQLEVKVEDKPFYMSVQTNALYWLGIVPNVGVEFYLGKNWSVDANWYYSWWKNDNKSWYWRTYGGDIAVRKWFGKSANKMSLTGHHVGAYAQMLTYDVEVGGRGFQADRWNWSAGVEYGYSLPISYRMNIDFTLGVGYHWGEFDEYLPIDGHYVWQATKSRRYVGPTKAEISLVWPIGSTKNANSRKGEKR